MKYVFWVISGIIMLGGVHSVNSNMTSDVITTITNQILHESDEDPIVLRGHVRNQAGLPVADASVGLKKPGQSTPTYSTTTNSSGDYLVSGIESGSYTLGISASGYVPKAIPVSMTTETERTDTLIAQ